MGTSTRELTKETFEQTIDAEGIVLIDWWAPWCGPCRTFGPVFEKAAEANPDIVFAKVNTEDQPELAGGFNIRSIPTLFIFRDRVLLFAQPGALPASALTDILQKVRDLDMNEVRAKIAAEEEKEAKEKAAGGGEKAEDAAS